MTLVYFHGDARVTPQQHGGGHYLVGLRGQEERPRLPWRYGGGGKPGEPHLDTGLVSSTKPAARRPSPDPEWGQDQGFAWLHHAVGWTALAFWDRSGDTRGNSNSVFIAEGTHDFAAMKRIARESFPSLALRCAVKQLRPAA